MTSNTPSTNTIENLVADTLAVIDLLASIPSCGKAALDGYRDTCSDIPGHIKANCLKVAVVGVIKSGKSTFINALVKKEVVKRGAGAMTAITTRIRKGKKNKAILSLKSWDQINQALDKILDMFPQDKPEALFDLRRKKDRDYLTWVFESLEKEFPVTGEGLRPEALMIRNALEGFEACSQMIQADETRVSFEGKAFDRHKIYTADPARAFYIKDVCLEVYGKTIEPGVEIADCQGADSTDPAQLAQVISYIQGANLIVYCISSRTGLRQSDIAFLKTIERLGLMGNVLFINNCDLTEHDSLEDLKRIEATIVKELGYLTPEPRLYTFSALYNLFEQMPRLSGRNADRLALWKKDKAMAGYSTDNTIKFKSFYETLLNKNRYELLYANHLERIRMTAQALLENCDLVSGLLEADLEDQARAKAQLMDIEENASRLKVIVDNSIQGAVAGLAREIEDNLKMAFLKDGININKKVSHFITAAKMDVTPYRSGVKDTGFKQILYLMFQEFKRQLDLFAIEEVVPELRHLVETQEKRIETYFQSLLDSYQIDFPAIGSQMGEDVRHFSFQLLEKDPGSIKAVDINAIKKILGLTFPEQVFSVRFNTRMRANALTDFGLHSLVLFISALLDKHVRFSFTPGFDKAALKIKKESLALVKQQIKRYHLTLKQAYFAPLIDAVTRDFKEKILKRFRLYESMNRDMDQIFRLKQGEKQEQQKKLSQARETIRRLLEDLENFSVESTGALS